MRTVIIYDVTLDAHYRYIILLTKIYLSGDSEKYVSSRTKIISPSGYRPLF